MRFIGPSSHHLLPPCGLLRYQRTQRTMERNKVLTQKIDEGMAIAGQRALDWARV